MSAVRRTMRPLWAAVCALAMAGTAAVRAADTDVSLTRVYKKGAVVRHKITLNGQAGGTDFTVSSGTKQEISEVTPEGKATVVLTNEASRLSVGGQEMEQPAEAPITFTRDRAGRLLSVGQQQPGIFSPEVQHLLLMLSEVLLPEKAVATGGTWETVLDNPAVKDGKVTVKGTFVGMDKIGEASLWKIRQTVDAPVDAAGKKLTVESTSWLDPADGQIVKQESSVKDAPSQFGEMSWTSVIERVK